MRYSIEPRYQIVVKCYGFLLFTKIVGKNLNRPSGQKLLDSIKKMHSKMLQKDHQCLVNPGNLENPEMSQVDLENSEFHYDTLSRTLKTLKYVFPWLWYTILCSGVWKAVLKSIVLIIKYHQNMM